MLENTQGPWSCIQERGCQLKTSLLNLRRLSSRFLQMSRQMLWFYNFKTWLSDVFITFVQGKKKPVVVITVTSLSWPCVIKMKSSYMVSVLMPPIWYSLLDLFGSMNATWPSIFKTHLDSIGEIAYKANFAKLLKELRVNCASPPQLLLRSSMRPKRICEIGHIPPKSWQAFI